MPKVLVVDDAAFMRVTLKKVLEPAGYQVEEATNGVEAVSRYGEVRPDVVTMDITMPEKDGIQATKEIVASDPNARVIVVSALGQEKMVKDAILAGAKDFIVKPFQPDRVLDAIGRALS
ncbi:MAG: response regulator [Candidatus Omnitrophica bacterium]|nr:Chemotaxis protein CheY [bacterium]NUN97810.1 response regulator [Candidatus Omnitrophota bacterium]